MDNLDPGPVFVFTMHRSGGTLLARILNCHPDLVIWGEHGGWINKLAETDFILSRIPEVNKPLSERGLAPYAIGQSVGSFMPWASPFERRDFLHFCERLIRDSFSKGIRLGQRWGFKEIRYHTLLTARFLADLFPSSQFVLLRRALTEVVASSVLADWSMAALPAPFPMDSVVSDCAYATCAIDRGFSEIENGLRDRCFTLHYERLRTSVPELFEWLSLPDHDSTVGDKIAAAFNVRTGETTGDEKLRLEVLQTAEGALAKARAEIAERGINLARLKRLSGGRYTFLLGDHHLVGTQFSSMF